MAGFKMRALLVGFALALCAEAQAETVVAARAVPGRSIIGPNDIAMVEGEVPGAFASLDAALGLEARVTLYPGRPVRLADLGPPTIVDRNDVVQLRYQAGALTIITDGRALDRAGVGEQVRVMNLASRQIISGRVSSAGYIEVGK